MENASNIVRHAQSPRKNDSNGVSRESSAMSRVTAHPTPSLVSSWLTDKINIRNQPALQGYLDPIYGGGLASVIATSQLVYSSIIIRCQSNEYNATGPLQNPASQLHISTPAKQRLNLGREFTGFDPIGFIGCPRVSCRSERPIRKGARTEGRRLKGLIRSSR